MERQKRKKRPGKKMLFMIPLLFAGYRMWKNYREMRNRAFSDSLTGSWNFERFCQLAEERSRKNPNCCIVCVNIHQFKFINEIFGREQADRLLCHLKEEAEKTLREGELLCRESADFFYLFLRDTKEEKIKERLEHIMGRVSGFFNGDHSDYRILFYCGAVISDEKRDVYALHQMLTHVMFALAKAREIHQNNVWFFDTDLHKKEIMDNYVEGHMYQALKDEEFKLYLQPKIDLRNNSICGAEALVRWIKKDGEVIFPGQFIPIFEKNGFCARLDMYMVECVCKELREWIDAGIEPIPISINQSKLVFYEKDYQERLLRVLDKYRIPPNLITLEILEGIALDNVEELNRKIESLQAKGIRISMDDFGSGFSSLNTLGRLKIDELKLDRGFLMEAAGERDQREKLIMEHIVMLAGKLQIQTVAEGVETKENDGLIKTIGCDCGQGYYYSRPISAREFTEKYMKKK